MDPNMIDCRVDLRPSLQPYIVMMANLSDLRPHFKSTLKLVATKQMLLFDGSDRGFWPIPSDKLLIANYKLAAEMLSKHGIIRLIYNLTLSGVRYHRWGYTYSGEQHVHPLRGVPSGAYNIRNMLAILGLMLYDIENRHVIFDFKKINKLLIEKDRDFIHSRSFRFLAPLFEAFVTRLLPDLTKAGAAYRILMDTKQRVSDMNSYSRGAEVSHTVANRNLSITKCLYRGNTSLSKGIGLPTDERIEGYQIMCMLGHYFGSTDDCEETILKILKS